MDIILNKRLAYDSTKALLEDLLGEGSVFLVWEDVSTWQEQGEDDIHLFEYFEVEDSAGEFKYGLSYYKDDSKFLSVAECVAKALSDSESAAVFCGAERVLLSEVDEEYSVLFESGSVYLVDSSEWDDSGEIIRLVEFTYPAPEVLIK